MLNGIPYDGDWRAFTERRKRLASGAATWPAVVLTSLDRHLQVYGWKIDKSVYEAMYAFIRAHPQLRSGWLKLASRLSSGTAHDHVPKGAPEDGYYPNEATHTASLSLSLAYFANWSDGYRSRWQLGYALAQYAWMLRGSGHWHTVPRLGKRALVPLMTMADSLIAEAVNTQRNAVSLWDTFIHVRHHSNGDWRAVFDSAIERLPHARVLYESAMKFSQRRWSGSDQDIDRVEALARKNNAKEVWVETLRARHLPKEQRVQS
ncbi:MAG TPA: hypothetical protein VNE58_16130 [Casimicrobiaceae bacterium]|nr:hypothetical protein [Casimicrobiaceae bacterium]